MGSVTLVVCSVLERWAPERGTGESFCPLSLWAGEEPQRRLTSMIPSSPQPLFFSPIFLKSKLWMRARARGPSDVSKHDILSSDSFSMTLARASQVLVRPETWSLMMFQPRFSTAWMRVCTHSFLSSSHKKKKKSLLFSLCNLSHCSFLIRLPGGPLRMKAEPRAVNIHVPRELRGQRWARWQLTPALVPVLSSSNSLCLATALKT